MYPEYDGSFGEDRYQEVLREIERDRLARIAARRPSAESSWANALSGAISFLRAYRLQVSVTRQSVPDRPIAS